MQRQRPRGTTSRDVIVTAALTVVDRVGIEALTIRAVAKLAGAPPMSLYTYFTSKNELLDLMYTEVARRLYGDVAQPTWQAELMATCQQVRDVLRVHPNWAPLLTRPVPPSGVQKRERLLRMMTEAGMAPEAAVAALSHAVIASIGLTLVDIAWHEGGQPDPAARYERLKDWMTAAATEEETVTRVGFTNLPGLEPSDTFEFTLRMLIAGIEAERWGQPASRPVPVTHAPVEALKRA
jgi:AcrR family transcriptional regulator